MKRIEKSVTSQMEAAQAAVTDVVSNPAQNMQAAWAQTWSQHLGRSGEIYGRLFAGLQDEVANFVQKRMDANLETMRACSACRGVNEALELQQSWLRTAVEHYSSQGVRMSELCRSALFPVEPEAAQQASDESRAVAAERKLIQEPQTHIQRAAE